MKEERTLSDIFYGLEYRRNNEPAPHISPYVLCTFGAASDDEMIQFERERKKEKRKRKRKSKNQIMKPNKKQIKVSELIKEQSNFWMSTNDILSPTHHCDISEVIRNSVVFDELTESEALELEERLVDLYYFVKGLK